LVVVVVVGVGVGMIREAELRGTAEEEKPWGKK
jgi:hypothetical protein